MAGKLQPSSHYPFRQTGCFFGISLEKGTGCRQVWKKSTVEELIWDKTVFGAAVQLSNDGCRFSAEIPWPACAVIDLDKMEARRYGRGCWPALAPDKSYRFWYFDRTHRNLVMVDTRKGAQHRIPLLDAFGI